MSYQIQEKAMVFGGDTLTATDIAAALEITDIGDPSRVAHLDKQILKNIYQDMVQMVEEAVDKMKTSAENIPVILGGGIILPTEIEGASKVVAPNHSAVSNAIGSVIAQVSGQVEKVYALGDIRKEDALSDAKKIEEESAIEAGADSATLETIDAEDIPLAYLPRDATSIRIKVAGKLA